MDATRRNAYLKALSIPQWHLRKQVPSAAVASAAASIDSNDVTASVPTAATELTSGKETARRDLVAALAADANVKKPTSGDSEVIKTEAEKKSVVVKDLSQFDLEQLATEVSQCNACDLHKTRKQTVFGVGHEKATWMIIGEAPGVDDESQGEPFLAASGQLLNQMLRAIGLAREEVYIANVLKCRLPNNREPKQPELLSCPPYLQRQIELVQPKIILLLGRIAAQTVLQSEQPMSKLRAQVLHHPIFNIPMVATYHPAYLLRAPREKRKAWEDLQLARQQILGE